MRTLFCLYFIMLSVSASNEVELNIELSVSDPLSLEKTRVCVTTAISDPDGKARSTAKRVVGNVTNASIEEAVVAVKWLLHTREIDLAESVLFRRYDYLLQSQTNRAVQHATAFINLMRGSYKSASAHFLELSQGKVATPPGYMALLIDVMVLGLSDASITQRVVLGCDAIQSYPQEEIIKILTFYATYAHKEAPEVEGRLFEALKERRYEDFSSELQEMFNELAKTSKSMKWRQWIETKKA
jgi:hypothetical protein